MVRRPIAILFEQAQSLYLQLDFSVLDNAEVSNLLFFGDVKLNIYTNRMFLEAAMSLMKKTILPDVAAPLKLS